MGHTLKYREALPFAAVGLWIIVGHRNACARDRLFDDTQTTAGGEDLAV